MSPHSQLKVRNDSTRQGPSRWDWSVWIEGPPDELDQVEFVEYVLHPTFTEPVVRRTDRPSGFKLTGRGWGEFMIHVLVGTKTGLKFNLDHWLRLEDRGGSPAPQPHRGEKPTIYVAFGRAEQCLATEICAFLGSKGLEVLTQDHLDCSEPFERAIRATIGRSDALVALLTSDPGRWVLAEIAQARQQQIPVLLIALGTEALPPEVSANVEPLRAQSGEPSEIIALLQPRLAQLNLIAG